MMNRSAFEDWLYSAPIIALGAAALALMLIAMAAGIALRSAHNRRWPSEQTEQGQEGYVVTAVLGLLALLLGFTLAHAVDRFEARRLLVLEEANAIGTTYLRAQVLGQPHRSRISRLLIDYTENRIALARQPRGAAQAELLATNDRLITDLWTATSAAFVIADSGLQTMHAVKQPMERAYSTAPIVYGVRPDAAMPTTASFSVRPRAFRSAMPASRLSSLDSVAL